MRLTLTTLALSVLFAPAALAADVTLLNVSYDPTRELYTHLSQAFAPKFKSDTGKTIEVKTSTADRAQARAASKMEADARWRWPTTSTPSLILFRRELAVAAEQPFIATSTIVFLVQVIRHPRLGRSENLACGSSHNPKTRRRWRPLAACGFVKIRQRRCARIRQSHLCQRAGADTGARGSTITFVERGIGDVLVAWENEAQLATNRLGVDKFDIVAPSISILAEPPVAVVDKVVERKGTRAAAEAFLDFIYSPQGQTIAAQNYYRPRDPAVAKQYEASFPNVDLLTIEDFGGWRKAQATHFNDHGVFDSIYTQ